MGNSSSCIPRCTSPLVARLVDPDGSLRRVVIPASAAEVMLLQAPGHVVARAEELIRTRRVIGMRADEQLKPGEVYLLLPMNRVGSRVNDRQMAVIHGSGGGGMRRRTPAGSDSKVFPDVARKEEDEELAEGSFTGLTGQQVSVHRRGKSRQWRPFLDTIPESD